MNEKLRRIWEDLAAQDFMLIHVFQTHFLVIYRSFFFKRSPFHINPMLQHCLWRKLSFVKRSTKGWKFWYNRNKKRGTEKRKRNNPYSKLFKRGDVATRSFCRLRQFLWRNLGQFAVSVLSHPPGPGTQFQRKTRKRIKKRTKFKSINMITTSQPLKKH